MADLVTAQLELFRRIARTVENLSKLGRAKVTASVVKVRLELLQTTWQKFEDNHTRLLVLSEKETELKDETYFTKEIFDTCEETYLEQRARMFELLETLEASGTEKKSTEPMSSCREHVPRASLAKISLPTFSGRFQDWPSFRDLFKSLVIEDSGLADVERYHYLRSCLAGNALLRLKNVPLTEQNFKHAWELLTARYENARLIKCLLCGESHFIARCLRFKKLSIPERHELVRKSALCPNCLSKHALENCKSSNRCRECGKTHHTSLHRPEEEITGTAIMTATSSSERSRGVKTNPILSPPGEIRLATALVQLHVHSGPGLRLRALIDPGSQVSLVHESVVQRLKLPRLRAELPLFGLSGSLAGITRGVVSLSLSAHFSDSEKVYCRAYAVPSLTRYKHTPLKLQTLPEAIRQLQLADPGNPIGGVDILLGADVYPMILRDGLVINASGDLAAQNSVFGWLLIGSSPASSTVMVANAGMQVHSTTCLSEVLERFWRHEEVERARIPSVDEAESEAHFRRTHSRTSEGRYVVRLPFKEDHQLGESRAVALSRLENLQRRLQRTPELKQAYAEFLQEYECLGHMRRMTGVPRSTYFLPHHGVLKPSSTTTKLRVVFNASQTTTNGRSLNDVLRCPANLLPDLADLLLRWRRHRVVFTADIEKMYRQIWLHPDDCRYQAILWGTDGEEVTEYQLQTVTYGLNCAPFLAIRTLHQLAEDHAAEFPRASEILRRDVYMDDVLSGADTYEEATSLAEELTQLCKAGGFSLRKWRGTRTSTNEPSSFMELWEAEDPAPVLGVQWSSSTDSFHALVNSGMLTKAVTRRQVLSQIARLFDPLGWLAPVVVTAKIYMQGLWLLHSGWDPLLPENELQKWRSFQEELPQLHQLQLPRWIPLTPANLEVQLHGFADASERAYAAVIYARSVLPNREVKISLVGAKTKVAPLKQVSLPKLELSAACLLVRLMKRVLRVLALEGTEVHLWSDSTVALGWIQGHPSRWKTYVANRVSEIQTLLPEAIWHHVEGRLNPADIASRGVMPHKFATAKLWWEGPSFLHKVVLELPLAESFSTAEEARATVHVVRLEPPEESPILVRFSSLLRLLRFTAWCFRWRNRSDVPRGQSLTAKELRRAKLHWIRLMQLKHFGDALQQLRKGNPVPRNSPLVNLPVFLDDDGLIRLKGRLQQSHLSTGEKYPFLLPAKSYFSYLFILDAHLRSMHGGTQTTLAFIRQEAWLLRGRQEVRAVLHRCLTCVRWRGQAARTATGPLPEHRVTPARPFLHVGTDYAGPFPLVASRGRGRPTLKAYIALFVCFCTRAVHLELVSALDTASFIAALKRLFSWRGHSEVIYSDCGSNFVGAHRELRELRDFLQKENATFGHFCADRGVEWRFNPPGAPHFGGLWEAAVKSTKFHLRRVVGNQRLTFEEFSTLLTEVEAVLNSRPLQPLTDDPSDLSVLTPGHFLIGEPLSALVEPSLEHLPSGRLSRWQLVEAMKQHFWRRWKEEYLHALQSCSAVRNPAPGVQVGDLCLLRDENVPPSRWPLARVTAIHPGPDDITRVVNLAHRHDYSSSPREEVSVTSQGQRDLSAEEG